VQHPRTCCLAGAVQGAVAVEQTHTHLLPMAQAGRARRGVPWRAGHHWGSAAAAAVSSCPCAYASCGLKCVDVCKSRAKNCDCQCRHRLNPILRRRSTASANHPYYVVHQQIPVNSARLNSFVIPAPGQLEQLSSQIWPPPLPQCRPCTAPAEPQAPALTPHPLKAPHPQCPCSGTH